MKYLVSLISVGMLLFSTTICSAMGAFPTTLPKIDVTTGDVKISATATLDAQYDYSKPQSSSSGTTSSGTMKMQNDFSMSVVRN